MTPAAMTARTRIDGFALLLAVFAAPASSFLLWAVWMIASSGLGAAGPGVQLLGGLFFLMLFATWGALPAALFGAPILWLIQRRTPEPPMWILIIAGLAAAALYAGCAYGLALAGHQWVFLAAPWTTDLLDPEAHGVVHAGSPMIVAIVLSGAVGALVYGRVSRRRGQA